MILNLNNRQREILLTILKESQYNEFSEEVSIIISRIESLK